MGRGKRSGGTLARPICPDIPAILPLSDVPRSCRMGMTLVLDPTPAWNEDFAARTVSIVNLHGKGDYNAAKDAAEDALEILFVREPDNAVDPFAVIAYVDSDGDVGPTTLGYVEAEEARELSEQLRLGAPLRGKAQGRPYSGRESRGGCMEVLVFLEGTEIPF